MSRRARYTLALSLRQLSFNPSKGMNDAEEDLLPKEKNTKNLGDFPHAFDEMLTSICSASFMNSQKSILNL